MSNLLDEMLYGEPRERRLTRRQNKLLRALCDPEVKSMAEAGRVAGYSPHGVAGIVAKSSSIQSALSNFLQVLEKSGVTDTYIAESIRDGLKATETKFFQHEGAITDTAEVIDYATRHRYIETALRLKRLLANKGEEEKPQQQINIQIVNYDTLSPDPNTHP